MRPSRTVMLGMLLGLTVLLQLGPAYLPGGSMVLAMAATLPTAIAAVAAPRRCNWFFVAACWLIGLAAVEEMFVYLAMTGPLGLMLGLTYDSPRWKAVTFSALVLTVGMLILPSLAGVYPWGGVERSLAPAWQLAGYGGFALAYAALWRGFLGRVLTRLPLEGYTGGKTP